MTSAGHRPDVPGTVRHEAEGALLFLGVVQPEHGIQPLEQATEFNDVLGLDGLAVESDEQPPEPSDLVFDLSVGTAHRRRRVRPAQGSANSTGPWAGSWHVTSARA